MPDPRTVLPTSTLSETSAATSSAPPRQDARDGNHPPLLDDYHLRLMATWAAGAPDQLLAFDVIYGTCDEAAPTAEQRIQARTSARPSDLQFIRPLPADANPSGGAADGDGVPAGRWDAAFWSEASVEKFLVPYLAALAGRRALPVLQTVMKAWNHYPADRPAVGLLHRAGRLDQPLSLEHLIDVMYLDRTENRIRIEPLHSFLPGCDERVPDGPGPVPSLRITCREGVLRDPEERVFDELVLRRMAEWASSYRGKTLYFDDGTGTRLHEPFAAPPLGVQGRQVVAVHTPATRPDRPRMRLELIAGEARRTLKQADAAFWGNGAVEHIMIPYYASVYGAVVLRAMDRIYEAWWAGHPSATPGFGEGIETANPLRGADAEPDLTTYALVHLPRSDWDPETEGEGYASPVAAVCGPMQEGGELQLAPLTVFGRRGER